jgi:hypothetical protein
LGLSSDILEFPGKFMSIIATPFLVFYGGRGGGIPYLPLGDPYQRGGVLAMTPPYPFGYNMFIFFSYYKDTHYI